MPIGKYQSFAALRASLMAKTDKKIGDPNAYTAQVARKMEPGFGKGPRKKGKRHGP